MSSNIYLIGMPGSGKTATGKILAKDLSLTFVDTDDRIIKKAGKSIRDIFEQDGEDKFRELESECLTQESQEASLVVATGGGIVLRDENWEKMNATGKVVYLKTSADWILKRTKRASHRPLLNVEESKKMEQIDKLLSERSTFYEKADIICDTDGKSPQAVAKEIEGKLK